MKKILFVEASPMAESSASRKIARVTEKRLRAKHPDAVIVKRDLAAEPIPHIDGAALGAMRSGGDEAKLSDELVEEVLDADVIVLASPMWNFGLPSVLKAWIDHVARAGRTFRYSESGPIGLLSGKKAIVIASSGGVYSEGVMQAMDFVVPYLKAVLGFLGIKDIQIVRVEGTAIPQRAEASVANAAKAVETLDLGPAYVGVA